VGIKPLVAIGLWLAVIGAGFAWLAVYEFRPGKTAVAPHTWPASSHLDRGSNLCTLVLFLHPYCACSYATLEELSELRSRHASQLRTLLVFCRPQGTPAGWEKTSLWQRAGSIKGATVYYDNDDSERRQFGALTSGQVFVYDARGRLCYSGGITRARGQIGTNAGLQAVESLLDDRQASIRACPVYGCPLVDPER
jgi:hypothetical protein